MAMDIHNNVKVVRCLSPIAKTTIAATVGKVVDRAGYQGVELTFSYGSITATDATLTVIVKEGDVTGTMTSVANADLLGTEAAAGIAATTPRTSGVSKNITKRIGYIGSKRYVVGSLSSTVTAATIVGINVMLSNPRLSPVAT